MEVIVAFRAGLLQLEGKVLKPDPRRGQIAVAQSDDGLIHVKWSERNGDGSSAPSNAELDSVIFPDEAKLEQVTANLPDCLSDAESVRLAEQSHSDQAPCGAMNPMQRTITFAWEPNREPDKLHPPPKLDCADFNIP